MNKKEIKNLICQSFEKDLEFERSALSGNEDESIFDEILELNHQIFRYFGLPYADRFLDVYYDYSKLKAVAEKDVDNAYNRLAKAAEEFLTAPVLPDEKRLGIALQNKENVYDILPELKIRDFHYFVFLYNELLLKKSIEIYQFLDEVNKVEKNNLYSDIDTLYHNNLDIFTYRNLKYKYKLAFIDKFIKL